MANEFKNTTDFIKKFGKEVEAEIKNRLLTKHQHRNGNSYNSIASGKLYKSVKFQYRESLKQLEASWRMEDYGLYVDKGVKPQPKYLTGKGTGKSKFIESAKKISWIWNVNPLDFLSTKSNGFYWDGERNEEHYKFVREFLGIVNRYYMFELKYLK